MRMYAISVDEETADNPLSKFVLNCLKEVGISRLRIVHSESEKFPVSSKNFLLEQDKDALLEILYLLEADEEFLTIGWDNIALLIPFEGRQFNLVVGNVSTLPKDNKFTVVDATEVLVNYADAYEGFGLKEVFPTPSLNG